jgi:multidrug transporter EmrE-like cation transporter
MPYLLIVINICLMSVGQLLFKKAAVYINLNADHLNLVTKYLLNPWFYGAVFSFGMSTFVWVQILTKMKLSVAYPILSVSYIITAIGAFYLFSERLSNFNLIGILLIMIGVSLVSLR